MLERAGGGGREPHRGGEHPGENWKNTPFFPRGGAKSLMGGPPPSSYFNAPPAAEKYRWCEHTTKSPPSRAGEKKIPRRGNLSSFQTGWSNTFSPAEEKHTFFSSGGGRRAILFPERGYTPGVYAP